MNDAERIRQLEAELLGVKAVSLAQDKKIQELIAELQLEITVRLKKEEIAEIQMRETAKGAIIISQLEQKLRQANQLLNWLYPLVPDAAKPRIETFQNEPI